MSPYLLFDRYVLLQLYLENLSTDKLVLLQLRSEFSLCRLYTKSGTLRQFDRRPLAADAAGGGAGDNPGPSTAAAVSPDDDDGGSGGSMQPLEEAELMEGGGRGDPYGDDDVATLAALLYWPAD